MLHFCCEYYYPKHISQFQELKNIPFYPNFTVFDTLFNVHMYIDCWKKKKTNKNKRKITLFKCFLVRESYPPLNTIAPPPGGLWPCKNSALDTVITHFITVYLVGLFLHSYTPHIPCGCCNQSEFRIFKMHERGVPTLFLYKCTLNTLRTCEHSVSMCRIDSFTFWVILFCW